MNQILTISPYWSESSQTWVFDDKRLGIVQEPFVEGIPEMIDEITADITNAKSGFRLLFSLNPLNPFPNFQRQLVKLREEYGGTWYQDTTTKKEGWLCAVLFEYFPTAPDKIYVKAESF